MTIANPADRATDRPVAMPTEPLDLDAIRQRYELSTELTDVHESVNRLYASSRDVPALLAEVERLYAIVRECCTRPTQEVEP